MAGGLTRPASPRPRPRLWQVWEWRFTLREAVQLDSNRDESLTGPGPPGAVKRP